MVAVAVTESVTLEDGEGTVPGETLVEPDGLTDAAFEGLLVAATEPLALAVRDALTLAERENDGDTLLVAAELAVTEGVGDGCAGGATTSTVPLYVHTGISSSLTKSADSAMAYEPCGKESTGRSGARGGVGRHPVRVSSGWWAGSG